MRRAHATLRCDGVRVEVLGTRRESACWGMGYSYSRVFRSSDCYSGTIWTVLPHLNALFNTMHIPLTADSSWPFAEDGTPLTPSESDKNL